MTTVPPAERVHAVPGTANFRDVGGYAARDGARVARGRLFRADGIDALGDAGRAVLRELGLRTVIDLRQAIESEQHPDDLAGLELEHVLIPVMGELSTGRITDLGRLYLLLLQQRGERLTEAVRRLAVPGALPALYHCAAGKDRTGLVTALVLGLLGVDEEEIVADYALTGELLRGPKLDRIRRHAVEAGLDEQTIAVALDAPAEAMRLVLDHLREQHGGAREYLLAHGATERELDALVDVLLER
jgi:protein-tyrosine phosphatase